MAGLRLDTPWYGWTCQTGVVDEAKLAGRLAAAASRSAESGVWRGLHEEYPVCGVLSVEKWSFFTVNWT